jgi:hypothetical protein
MSQIAKNTGGSPLPGIETLTGDSGGVVGPDLLFNTNLFGNPDIDIVGTPGTNSLQLTNLTKWTPYVVDAIAGAAPFSTIQAALDAANGAGGGVVLVRPGAYTENLTLYADVDLVGAQGQVDSEFLVVTGSHTLPAAGTCAFYGIWFKGTTSCFTAGAGTSKCNFSNCIYEITGIGYTFDIDGFSGELNLFDTLQEDTGTNGFVNNPTGACAVVSIFGAIGLVQNSGATAHLSGLTIFQGMQISIKVSLEGSATAQFNMGCYLLGTVITASTASFALYNSTLDTLALPAITHNSSTGSSISTVTVNSSISPAIEGTGLGTLNIGEISFISNAEIGGALTTSFGVIQSGNAYLDNISFDRGISTLDADGEIWIGSGSANPAPTTLTPGTGIDITNASNAITIGLTPDTNTTAVHAWNGSLLETSSVVVTSDGATITCSVEKAGGGDLTAVFSDGFDIWDTTPPDTVSLTAGSDISPQLNFVYYLQSTKTLTVSIVNWPITEHVPIATVICQSAASLQTDGAYKVHVWTDHVGNVNEQGHIYDLNFWVRQQNAMWQAGVVQTFTITTNVGVPDNVQITTTAGNVLQLHPHIFPSFPGPSPDYYVINDPTVPFNVVTDLNALLTDSTGASMAGRFFSLVLWGAVSEEGADSKFYINLPAGSYNNANALEDDAEGFADFDIPADFKCSGFLIAQWNLRQQAASGGTWTSIEEIDLRGLIPSRAPAGSIATPTTFPDNVFRIFDDMDITKNIAFQATNITTSTTRTITMVDADLDLATVSNSFPTDSGTAAPTANALSVLGGTNINTSGSGTTVTVNLEGTLDTPQATTSGTSFNFSGLPSNVKLVKINFDQVSLSGTDQIIMQIGPVAGVEVSGYSGHSLDNLSGTIAWSTEIPVLTASPGSASDLWSGTITMTLLDASTDTWSITLLMSSPTTPSTNWGSGSKSLAGPLEQLTVGRSGTDTFDNGKINIISYT